MSSGGLSFGDHVSSRILVPRKTKSFFAIHGWYKVEAFEGGDRSKRLWVDDGENLITNEGVSNFLEATIAGATGGLGPTNQVATWYLGLKQDNGLPAVTDTYTTHTNGWTEFDEYTLPNSMDNAVNRDEFLDQAIGGALSVSNTGFPATFEISAVTQMPIGGATLSSHQAKDNFVTAGRVLMSARNFSAPRTLSVSDVLEVTFTITGADNTPPP